MPVLEKYFNRKPCKVIEMNGEPDYGVGDFRIDRNIMQVFVGRKRKHRKNIIDIF